MESPPAHILCISCRSELDPTWSFCGACGADNRPPENRPRLGTHTHVYPTREHCIVCGKKSLDVDDMGQPVNRPWELLKSIVSVLLWPVRGWWWWD